jgi:hypothetical protein
MDFILAREGILLKEGSETPVFAPSPASGIEQYSQLSDEDKGEIVASDCVISSVTWLLKREHGNVQFRKYSGPLDHLCHNDKQGATINVFQHFSYFELNCFGRHPR